MSDSKQITIDIVKEFHCWNGDCIYYQSGICIKKWKERHLGISEECPIGDKTYRKEIGKKNNVKEEEKKK